MLTTCSLFHKKSCKKQGVGVSSLVVSCGQQLSIQFHYFWILPINLKCLILLLFSNYMKNLGISCYSPLNVTDLNIHDFKHSKLDTFKKCYLKLQVEKCSPDLMWWITIQSIPIKPLHTINFRLCVEGIYKTEVHPMCRLGSMCTQLSQNENTRILKDFWL